MSPLLYQSKVLVVANFENEIRKHCKKRHLAKQLENQDEIQKGNLYLQTKLRVHLRKIKSQQSKTILRFEFLKRTKRSKRKSKRQKRKRVQFLQKLKHQRQLPFKRSLLQLLPFLLSLPNKLPLYSNSSQKKNLRLRQLCQHLSFRKAINRICKEYLM